MQYTTDFQNPYFHLWEDSVRSVFPNFVAYYSSSTSSRIIVTGTKQLLVAIRHLFLTMKQLFFETYGRNFDLFWERALNANFEVFIQCCIMHSFVMSTKSKEVEGAGSTKFCTILLMIVHGFRRRRFTFRDM